MSKKKKTKSAKGAVSKEKKATMREQEAQKHQWQWTQAQDFYCLRDLTVRSLEGKNTFHPIDDGHYEETDAIRDRLVKLNRLGFLTTCSQPGVPFDGDGKCNGQRAFVTGFMMPERAERLSLLMEKTDMYLAVHWPFEPIYREGTFGELAHQIVVTLQDEGEDTSIASQFADSEVMEFARFCGAGAVESLEKSCYVVAIDFQWGRPDKLFDELVANLTVLATEEDDR